MRPANTQQQTNKRGLLRVSSIVFGFQESCTDPPSPHSQTTCRPVCPDPHPQRMNPPHTHTHTLSDAFAHPQHTRACSDFAPLQALMLLLTDPLSLLWFAFDVRARVRVFVLVTIQSVQIAPPPPQSRSCRACVTCTRACLLPLLTVHHHQSVPGSPGPCCVCFVRVLMRGRRSN